MRSRLRHAIAGCEGFSALEVAISSVILMVVMAMVMPLTTMGFELLGEHETRAAADADVQIAMRRVTRDVRSGNVIGSPYAVDGKAGMGVRVYTQTDGVPFRCVEYQVAGSELRRRDREPEGAWTDDWQLVATGVTNATSVPTRDAFVRSADKSTLSVAIVLDPPGTASPIEAVVSITGRNTRYYDTPFAEDTCA